MMRALITGLGICSPIGNQPDAVTSALLGGQSGIREIASFVTSRMTMRHAAEIDHIPQSPLARSCLQSIWDRGTRMSVHAAHAAIMDAGLKVPSDLGTRIGVCIGTSGSGQYQNARFQFDGRMPMDEELLFYLSRNTPHFQSAQVAAALGIHGPNLALGAATAGSGIAFAVALSWIRSGRVDLALVGGGESFSLLNVLGFDQLGLTRASPCTPFSGEPGMTFGEGAGFIVLESESHARRRSINIHAELASIAIRADGYDPILFDPTGDGQARAMREALAQAHLNPEEIAWIRSSGTGGRDQDLAETQAIKSTFPVPPPVTSFEPYLGHANGAGPAIGLVASILCMKRNFIPPILGFATPRPGCDLPYVTSLAETAESQSVLCNTAAFGGVNTAIVLKKHEAESAPRVLTPTDSLGAHNESAETIAITGVGFVSPVGCGGYTGLERFFSAGNALSTHGQFAKTPFADQPLGCVRDFTPREHCPAIRLRGLEPLTQYAAVATALALRDAGLDRNVASPERTGVVSGITRSSGIVFQRLFEELHVNGFRPSVGRLMLRNGRFMVASQLANWFDLRGYTATFALGQGCGLHALIAAYDQLRHDPSIDSLVVVACDEVSRFNLEILQRAKLLSPAGKPWRPYDEQSCGLIPAEGAIAVVLERQKHAANRNAKIFGQVAGASLSFDGVAGDCITSEGRPSWWTSYDPTGRLFAKTLRDACDSKSTGRDIDLLMCNGSGVRELDQRDESAFDAAFPQPNFPLASVNGQTGFAESCSSLLNLIAGMSAIASDLLPDIWRIARPEGSHNASPFLRHGAASGNLLACSASEHGHNAAIHVEVQRHANFSQSS